jgi:hypothetical protein
MDKDPAFLFYSQDFYTGTRLMTPEERACYIDLLIYQHQNGIIPLDIDRVLMFCSGVAKATLQATLQAKFKQCDKGWYNEKLNTVMDLRGKYKEHQSDSGLIGAFYKRAKADLPAKKYRELKDFIYNKYGKESLLNDLKSEATLQATLQGLLKHLENEIENEIEIENVNKDNNVVEEKAEIVFPFDSENFRAQWNIWKDYKQKEFDFKFKSLGSEQANLTQLSNLAENETEAIAIIHQSMANGWKGFFKIKNETNGVTKKHNFVFTADDFKR